MFYNQPNCFLCWFVLPVRAKALATALSLTQEKCFVKMQTLSWFISFLMTER
jgi:hypothetical protein